MEQSDRRGSCHCIITGAAPADNIFIRWNGTTMTHRHRNFWFDMLPKVGVPMFTATLVGCLFKEQYETIHFILMTLGLAFMYLGHRLEYHSQPAS